MLGIHNIERQPGWPERSWASLTRAAMLRRSWSIGKKGELEAGRTREKAHKDRVTALLAHAGFLYSTSYDGSVKMWDADTMELVQDVQKAHEGGRVNCAAVGADGNLYTGGDDKVCASLSQAVPAVLNRGSLCSKAAHSSGISGIR